MQGGHGAIEFHPGKIEQNKLRICCQAEQMAQIHCGNRRSVRQLKGRQIGTLDHSCSIMAGHSAMAASRNSPPDSVFQIRAIPNSLMESL